MIPVYLDPQATRVALVGDGPLALRRLHWLRDAGAAPDVWSKAPSAELAAAAGSALMRRLPSRADIACYHAIWVADLDSMAARTVSATARAGGVLVNVEDVVDLCDFHTPAVVRRGRLTLAAGTGGASPAVAKAARGHLEAAFGPEWETALAEIADARRALRTNGADAAELARDARDRLAYHGLMEAC